MIDKKLLYSTVYKTSRRINYNGEKNGNEKNSLKVYRYRQCPEKPAV
jgi:hypothetical protein